MWVPRVVTLGVKNAPDVVDRAGHSRGEGKAQPAEEKKHTVDPGMRAKKGAKGQADEADGTPLKWAGTTQRKR